MSDRYKNEPFNTPEQKAYEKALNKIKELEAKIVELEKTTEGYRYRGAEDRLWAENKNLREKLTEKEALLKSAVEVIEFYADPYNNSMQDDMSYYDYCPPMRATNYNIGKKAREFLAKLKAGEE